MRTNVVGGDERGSDAGDGAESAVATAGSDGVAGVTNMRAVAPAPLLQRNSTVTSPVVVVEGKWISQRRTTVTLTLIEAAVLAEVVVTGATLLAGVGAPAIVVCATSSITAATPTTRATNAGRRTSLLRGVSAATARKARQVETTVLIREALVQRTIPADLSHDRSVASQHVPLRHVSFPARVKQPS
jgi:hypothetical protein